MTARRWTEEELDQLARSQAAAAPRIEPGTERWHELRRLMGPIMDDYRAHLAAEADQAGAA